jgi:hypothetical protein
VCRCDEAAAAPESSPIRAFPDSSSLLRDDVSAVTSRRGPLDKRRVMRSCLCLLCGRDSSPARSSFFHPPKLSIPGEIESPSNFDVRGLIYQQTPPPSAAEMEFMAGRRGGGSG